MEKLIGESQQRENEEERHGRGDKTRRRGNTCVAGRLSFHGGCFPAFFFLI